MSHKTAEMSRDSMSDMTAVMLCLRALRKRPDRLLWFEEFRSTVQGGHSYGCIGSFVPEEDLYDTFRR